MVSDKTPIQTQVRLNCKDLGSLLKCAASRVTLLLFSERLDQVLCQALPFPQCLCPSQPCRMGIISSTYSLRELRQDFYFMLHSAHQQR